MHPLEQVLFGEVSEAFIRALTTSVFLARKDATESVYKDFARPEADNIYGFNVRARLEGLTRAAADRFGIENRVRKEPGQPWNHTEIVTPKLILTIASVRTPLAMVEPADYRVGLAQSGQMQLASLEDEPVADRHYAILTHCRWLESDFQKYGHLPQSIHIVFPAADFKGYVHHINLMLRYKDIVRKHVPQDWDEQAIVRYIERSRKTAYQ